MQNPVILYADDNLDDALLVRRALDRIDPGIHLETVPSSTEAIAYLRGSGKYADRTRYPLPALVLLDFRLPPGGGIQVLRWVRAHPDFSRLVIVFLTGSVFQRDVDEVYQYGANALIGKEMTFEALQESLEHLVRFWLNYNHMPTLAGSTA